MDFKHGGFISVDKRLYHYYEPACLNHCPGNGLKCSRISSQCRLAEMKFLFLIVKYPSL
jgi:hypothetical protein